MPQVGDERPDALVLDVLVVGAGQAGLATGYFLQRDGRSDWPWTGYDYDTLSDDLNALLNHLDVRDVILVGHSAGAGEVVRYVSGSGADRVAGIALIREPLPDEDRRQPRRHRPRADGDGPGGSDRRPREMVRR